MGQPTLIKGQHESRAITSNSSLFTGLAAGAVAVGLAAALTNPSCKAKTIEGMASALPTPIYNRLVIGNDNYVIENHTAGINETVSVLSNGNPHAERYIRDVNAIKPGVEVLEFGRNYKIPALSNNGEGKPLYQWLDELPNKGAITK